MTFFISLLFFSQVTRLHGYTVQPTRDQLLILSHLSLLEILFFFSKRPADRQGSGFFFLFSFLIFPIRCYLLATSCYSFSNISSRV